MVQLQVILCLVFIFDSFLTPFTGVKKKEQPVTESDDEDEDAQEDGEGTGRLTPRDIKM